MEYLAQILVFGGETLLVVIGVGAVLILIANLVARGSLKPDLEIDRLDERYQRLGDRVKENVIPEKDFKKEQKALKKSAKLADEKPVTYVLDFKGDIKASAVDCLREEINAILASGTKGFDVLLRLESPGGMVHSYGLAAAQLMRFRQNGIKMTICVDKVAASGGYMMACTGDKIVSAPFAIIGSIGVVANVPNFNRLLKKHDVEYKEYTAGEYKRTVGVLSEITPKGEEKFKQQLDETHVLFKEFIRENRPSLDVAKVATGEHWYGTQALALGLIDEVSTSDELLLKASKDRRVIAVKYNRKQAVGERLSGLLGKAFRQGLNDTIEDLENRRLV